MKATPIERDLNLNPHSLESYVMRADGIAMEAVTKAEIALADRLNNSPSQDRKSPEIMR